ncbi:hypothetical protein Taro_002426 [Colocasia esculenta]|uniref:Neprosin PEP catalytic domain-containing protein n=1 Tax=Colocasia esculenta TaxID=4460 RepID=A0A843TKS0_COLES|nr:hypothetical protein [Colocasia esculenta]
MLQFYTSLLNFTKALKVSSLFAKNDTHDRSTKDWWLRLQGGLLGYWPSHLVPQLHDGAQIHDFGGEILNRKPPGQHTGTQMGSGHFAHEGFKKSAYFRNILIADSEDPWKYTSPTRGDADIIITHPHCYDAEVADNIELQWGFYFFYGGPGRSASCP